MQRWLLLSGLAVALLASRSSHSQSRTGGGPVTADLDTGNA